MYNTNKNAAAFLVDDLKIQDIENAIELAFNSSPWGLGRFVEILTHTNRKKANYVTNLVTRNKDQLLDYLKNWLYSPFYLEAIAILLRSIGNVIENNSYYRSENAYVFDSPFVIFNEIENYIFDSLKLGIDRGALDQVGKFFLQISMTINPFIKQYTRNLLQRLENYLTYIFDSDKVSFIEILILFRRLKSIDKRLIKKIFGDYEIQERFVLRLKNRIKKLSDTSDLSELGDYFTLVSKIDRHLTELSINIIDWDTILYEIENEGSLGRISWFFEGLVHANFTFEKDGLKEKIGEQILSKVAVEDRLSTINDLLFNYDKIDNYNSNRIMEVICDENFILERIELEINPSIIAHMIEKMIKYDQNIAEGIVSKIDLKAIASKIYRSGQLLAMNNVIDCFKKLELVENEISSNCALKFIDKYIDKKKISEMILRESDMGFIANHFWALKTLGLIKNGEELLSSMTPEIIIKKIIGVRDTLNKKNMTGQDRSSMLKYFLYDNRIAKLSAFVNATKNFNRDWCSQFIDDLQLIYKELGGALAEQFGSDIIFDFVRGADLRHAAWLVRELLSIGKEVSSISYSEILRRSVQFLSDEKKLSDIGYILMAISNSSEKFQNSESLIKEIEQSIAVDDYKKSIYNEYKNNKNVYRVTWTIYFYWLINHNIDREFFEDLILYIKSKEGGEYEIEWIKKVSNYFLKKSNNNQTFPG